MQGFMRQLRSLGYEIKAGKYLAARPQGKERFTRLKTLGENYSEDVIKDRIRNKKTDKRLLEKVYEEKNKLFPEKVKTLRRENGFWLDEDFDNSSQELQIILNFDPKS
jgi:hypothetical protein